MLQISSEEIKNNAAGREGGNRVPTHDPDVCGLPGPPTCPACVVEARARSALARELQRIADRFERADRLSRRAESFGDWADAVGDREEAAGEFRAAGVALADLGLLLFRYMLRHRAEEVRGYLYDALRPEFEAVAAALKKGVRR
jgi:hypothetical protein